MRKVLLLILNNIFKYNHAQNFVTIATAAILCRSYTCKFNMLLSKTVLLHALNFYLQNTYFLPMKYSYKYLFMSFKASDNL